MLIETALADVLAHGARCLREPITPRYGDADLSHVFQIVVWQRKRPATLGLEHAFDAATLCVDEVQTAPATWLEFDAQRGMFRAVDAKHINEFVNRPRAAVDSLKAEWWAAHAGAGGGSLDAGHALLEHTRLVDPSFPSAEYLAADLEHHVVLKELLDRASKALASR